MSGPGERAPTWAPACLHTQCDGTLTPVPFVAVRYFLKNKVSPDLCNEDGLTALHQVRPGWQGSLAPCSPPGQVPHLPALSCPEASGGRERRGAAAAPFERPCVLRRHVCLLQTRPQGPCARSHSGHAASEDREPLSTASSLPSTGFGEHSESVCSSTVHEARLLTPTMPCPHPADKGDWQRGDGTCKVTQS